MMMQPGLEPTGYVHERAEIMGVYDCKVAGTNYHQFITYHNTDGTYAE
jgi:hypothetical protein